jgi:hypothetical protein
MISVGLILTHDLDLGPAEVTVYYTLIFQPYAFKPLVGLLTDLGTVSVVIGI